MYIRNLSSFIRDCIQVVDRTSTECRCSDCVAKRQKALTFGPKSDTTQTMKTQLLATAVLAAIGTFHASQRGFSAYNITEKIREQVNNGSLRISDLPTASTVPQFVPHDKVRAHVHELFISDLIPDFVARDTGTYINYDFQQGASAGSTPQIAARALTIPTTASGTPYTPTVTARVTVSRPVNTTVPTATGVGQAFAAPVTSPNAKALADADTLQSSIREYVDKKIRKGEYPTLKQIQSRLKRTPVTTARIKEILVSKGYRVQIDPVRPSYSLVSK